MKNKPNHVPFVSKAKVEYKLSRFPKSRLVSVMSNDTIQEKIEGIAKNIEAYISEKTNTQVFETVTYVGMFDGCIMFFADLLRHQDRDVRISPIIYKSYVNNKQTETPNIIADLTALQKSKIIVVCDTICDTGSTLQTITSMIKDSCPNAIVLTAVLLHKRHSKFTPDFIGRIIPNNWFVVGYGMDDRGLRRTFPSIFRIAEENEQ